MHSLTVQSILYIGVCLGLFTWWLGHILRATNRYVLVQTRVMARNVPTLPNAVDPSQRPD